MQRLGETQYAQVLADHHRLIREALAEHGGEEIDTQGDAFFAVFDSPRACARAVIDVQRAFAAQSWLGGEQVRLRMGVHSGEASRTATGLVGMDVHRAARLAGIAHGGQVVFSSAAEGLVRDSLPEGASFRDLGHHRLKDLGRPEHVFQLQADGLQPDFPPLRSLDNPAMPNNLSEQPSSFVGRERELSELRTLVDGNRLVTLTGAGGAGKTRLAIQVAAELVDGSGDGVWIVELAPISDEEAVASTVVQTIGISRRSDQSPLDTLTESLTCQRALILLDNCEHLIGACAKVADAILRRCPQVRLVATSREPLGIAGETIYRVPSMSLPEAGDGATGDGTTDAGTTDAGADGAGEEASDAVTLFVERARAQGVEVVLDRENAPLIARICRRLDGMPLAIELAASRLRALSLTDLDERLDQRFRLLTGGSRTALPRQQTLLATVNWSHSLLTAAEQILLRRLSVFVDGFDLEGAEAVCAGGDIDVFDVTELLGSLVDKSLVVAEPADGAVRYRLLETIRQFAAERLSESHDSEAAELQLAHCRHFVSVAEAARVGIRGREQALWFHRLEAEQGNIRRAMEHAAGLGDLAQGTELVLRLGAALVRFWARRVRLEGSAALLLAALERPEARVNPALRGGALVSAAFVTRGIDVRLAQRFATEAVEVAQQVGEERLVVDAANALCTVLYFAGSPESALPYGEAAVDLARRSGDDTLLGPSLVFLSLCTDPFDPKRSAALLAEAIASVERSGDQDLASVLYNNAGVSRLRHGDLVSARRFLQRAEEANRAVGSSNTVPLINLGWVLRQELDTTGSGSTFERALRQSHRAGEIIDIPYAMLGLACHAADTGYWRRSAVLHGVADALMDRSGEPWQDPEDSYQRENLEAVRTHLGGTDFDAAYAEGRGLDLLRAIDVALQRT